MIKWYNPIHYTAPERGLSFGERMFNIGDVVRKKKGALLSIGEIGVVYEYYRGDKNKVILCVPGKQHMGNLTRKNRDLSGYVFAHELELVSRAGSKPRPKQIDYQEGII